VEGGTAGVKEEEGKQGIIWILSDMQGAGKGKLETSFLG
jgi:hypothetical protein